ncbi:MAG: stage III sporulation protein AB [Clostridia bacterium]|nr:stage III sporulation protein AB [Clostridia bacterium]
MELKYVAVTVILLLSFYIAYYIKHRGEEKLLLYEALYDFIEYIKYQIEFFCTPTDEMIANYDNPILEKYEFLVLLDNNDWSRAIHESKASSLLDKRIVSVLEAFSSKLGTSSGDEQTANCEYTLCELKKVLDTGRQELPKKLKAFSAISVISGFMAIILIL